MQRTVALLIGLFILLAATVAAADAPPDITLGRVEPVIPAIRAISRTAIEIRNPAEELVLLDKQGAPFLRMTQDGVFERQSDGSFETVRAERFFYINEIHIGKYAALTGVFPAKWSMAGTYGGTPFVMEGLFVPPAKVIDRTPYSGETSYVGMMAIWALLLFGVGWIVYVKFIQRSN